MIKVYKLRTMHPYSEFIQSYVYRLHDLQGGGKFKNDFRITSWGAICRKIWLDELPMLMNFFRGDMKLIGVRPLSRHYFELYRKDVQERRIKYKPGLIPPFYADMPGDLEADTGFRIKIPRCFTTGILSIPISGISGNRGGIYSSGRRGATKWCRLALRLRCEISAVAVQCCKIKYRNPVSANRIPSYFMWKSVAMRLVRVRLLT